MKRILMLTALSALTTMVSVSPAQTPRLANANQTTRSAAEGLAQVVGEIARGSDGVVWIGYSVPVVADSGSRCCGSCWSRDNGCCGEYALEGDSRRVQTRPGHSADRRAGPAATVSLDESDQGLVFLRVERHAIGKVRLFSDDCFIDGRGLSVVWLPDVQPAQSLAFLKTLALSRFTSEAGDEGEGSSRSVSNGALQAIAMHRGESADEVLEDLVTSSRPEGLRKQVTFWMGAERGRRGYEALTRVMRTDASEKVRESAVFGLSVSREPDAITLMIATARDDRSSQVRGQALFWLAQKAGRKAAAAITDAIERDPETDVKKKAVFALSQLPSDEGVPLLIRVARSSPNPAVRERAVFWLGQSNDSRAIQFFEDVLR